MVIIIDNYDSFTFNLAQAIGALSHEVKVFRNDQVTVNEVEAMLPAHIIISPGPCTPAQSGISIELIHRLQDAAPILGVCLGHQAIAAAFGADVVRAPRLMHGKTSPIFHDCQSIFKNLPNPFEAMRYHSLIVDENTLPGCFIKNARTDRGELMAIRHAEKNICGVQFHPESFMTPSGVSLIKNFLDTPTNPAKTTYSTIESKRRKP